MKYALIHVRDSKLHVGNDLTELLSGFKHSLSDRRRVILDGIEDGMSFADEFTPEELSREVRKRALDMLLARGWTMYKYYRG